MNTVRVGWFVDVAHGEVVFDPPKPVRDTQAAPANPSSPVLVCPAINQHTIGLYCVNAPFSFCVSVRLGEASCSLVLDQKRSSLKAWKAKEFLRLMPRSDWRSPDHPVLQVMLPYTFVTDEELVVRQLPPYLHYFAHGRPGIVLAGEFPIRNWPRPLSWAFEWRDSSKSLHVQRGEPLYYVSFELRQDVRVQLERVSKSAQIEQQQKRIGGVTALVRNSLRFTEAAGQHRAEQLLPEQKNGKETGDDTLLR
jgi:hypothetical protein